jgi:hypothetical protein
MLASKVVQMSTSFLLPFSANFFTYSCPLVLFFGRID